MVYLELLQKLHENGGGIARADVAGALLIAEDEAERAVERLKKSGRIIESDGMLSNPRVSADTASEIAYRAAQAVPGSKGGKTAGRGRPKGVNRATPNDDRATPNPDSPAYPPPSPSPSPSPSPVPPPGDGGEGEEEHASTRRRRSPDGGAFVTKIIAAYQSRRPDFPLKRAMVLSGLKEIPPDEVSLVPDVIRNASNLPGLFKEFATEWPIHLAELRKRQKVVRENALRELADLGRQHPGMTADEAIDVEDGLGLTQRWIGDVFGRPLPPEAIAAFQGGRK
jgi:hypothetical protein